MGKRFICFSVSAWFAVSAGADFEYRIEPDSTLTITSYVGIGGDVSIPPMIAGHTVAAIGPAAFADCAVLTGIAVPDSVVSIGEGAFRYCYSLTQAALGNGVRSLDNYAFYSCTSLTNVAMGTNLSAIGNAVFFYCGSLGRIAVPAGVSSIGALAFQNCPGLVEITVAEDNAVYASLDGVLFDESMATLIQCPGGRVGDYSIPAGVAAIGNGAFRYCYGLTGIALPASVAAIGAAAFLNCSSLTNYLVADGNAEFAGVNGVLFNRTQTRLVQCPGGKIGSYAVPDGVAAIADAAFYGCGGLTEIAIPASVVSVGSEAFYGCAGLVKITIPGSVAQFGLDAFKGCSSLVAVCFGGNAPNAAESVFNDGSPLVVYRLYDASGWQETFAGQPTAIWPEFRAAAIQPAGFVVEIVADADQHVVLEKCLNPSVGEWTPVSTNTIVGGPLEIAISDWTNDPMRHYRLVLP